jgi:hypothetical protein
MILEKRREVRRREEEENMGYSTPPRNTVIGNTLNVEGGRPSRRRSMSTGDVELLSGAAKKRGALMRGEDGGLLEDVVPFDHQEDPLGDSIDRELRKLEGPSKNVSFITVFWAAFGFLSAVTEVSDQRTCGDDLCLL